MKFRPSHVIAATAALAGTLGMCLEAQAHGIWFAQRARQIALIYGIGADDLDMVQRLPLLGPVTGYDADWKPVPIRVVADGAIPVVKSDAPYAAAAATMDYGTWTKQKSDGEFVKKPKDEVPDAEFAEHTFKYTVFLAQPLKQPVPLLPGHRLQIVPDGTDIPKDIGDPIKLKVYFDGKPSAGVQILTDFVNDPDMPPLMTGPDGTVSFRLRNQGLNVIAATIIGKTDQPKKYDYIEYRATLSFVLPHAPE